MVGVKPVGSDPDFQPELSGAGSRLAVVKFTMRGCGPCLRIAPAFSSMSNKYPQAVFLEVDVHQCQGTAATNNISATPTFLFFRNKVRIDQYQGADAVGLEEKIKQHLENDPGSNEDTDIPKGYMDLMPFINKAGCECLNESDEHGFDNCLRKDMSFLESDCDEQLLITVAFNQPVKLYSMKFQGPDNGQGPKYVKIFINLPRSMDFEEAERSEPTQALELTEDDIKEDGIVPLRYVKFQNVNSVTLFVQSNQGEEETTRISYFTFIGTPVQATNMNDFKRGSQKESQHHHVVALEDCMGTSRCGCSTMCHSRLHTRVDRSAHVLVLEHEIRFPQSRLRLPLGYSVHHYTSESSSAAYAFPSLSPFGILATWSTTSPWEFL
ncbi:Thioredoxin-like protein 1 [Microtus ochrogaster]|uniref:Thioredoxin-like protein 1 n=2 Tax=Cricetidae TaxID=337677 RepID=A0A8J6KVH2_MICOH|nr:Thioredoxin-like protein 1 [Microtus ochrogaster]